MKGGERMSLSKVTLRFNKEQEKKLGKLGVMSGRDLKRFIIGKIEEELRQNVLVAMLKLLFERLEAFENMSKEMFLEAVKRVESVEELVSAGSKSVDSDKLDKVIDVVYEMLKLFILNYTQLYRDNVKQKVLEDMMRLRSSM